MSTPFETYVFYVEFVILLLIFIPTMIAFLYGAPWVPTPVERVKKMLELAKIKPGDVVFDLGCGDGRMVDLAARHHGAQATGFELSPMVYAWARLRLFISRSRAKVLMRDFRYIDMKKADILVLYLLPAVLKKMKSKFETELPPGARIVSYAFEIEGWEPIYTEPRVPEKNFGRIFIYEVPTSIKPSGSPAKTEIIQRTS